MTTDPYEIARRIAREKLMVNLEKPPMVWLNPANLRDALLAAIEEGRRLGAHDISSTKTTPNANSLQL